MMKFVFLDKRTNPGKWWRTMLKREKGAFWGSMGRTTIAWRFIRTDSGWSFIGTDSSHLECVGKRKSFYMDMMTQVTFLKALKREE